MKASNKAYLTSGMLGAMAGFGTAMALFEPGRTWIFFPIIGALIAHSLIWGVFSVAMKLAND